MEARGRWRYIVDTLLVDEGNRVEQTIVAAALIRSQVL